MTALVVAALGTAPAMAQTATQESPLSVIDWLGTQLNPQPATREPAPRRDPNEAPVATSALPPKVTVSPLGEGSPRAIGLVPGTVTGLPQDLWSGSPADALIDRIEALPELRLPAAQSLLYTVLLAEAYAPQGGIGAGDALARARVEKLMRLGALDPALSLIEQAGVTTSPDHYDLWMEISLLTGTEDRACDVLGSSPHLTRSYGVRIFCAARAGNWDNAALTFGSAQALGLLPQEQLALLDRFLHPETFEGLAPLPVPRSMDPLSFRLFESIGEPMPTGTLPRAFAVADLRDIAGWKAQLEAAERLTRAGALPDNRLLGLYTDRAPAASGGVWDRVRALQRFETALDTGSPDAVAKTLPTAWIAMQDAGLEVAFAGLFAERLADLPLEGRAARIAFEVCMLSPFYEAAAADPSKEVANTDLLRAIARGEVPQTRPEGALPGAIYDAFNGAAPREHMVAAARDGQLGEVILQVLAMLQKGSQGDTTAMRDALSTLRALGLEDTARRAALQTILLER
ncbi:hypothetical protein BOO69_09320 [Sulfitobacter alexandrii]|uniref:Antifreeze protein n=1 Tax=Sulfitobacter alexandrii TaxID=1917485 RepID=A0A1J0WGY2_9RHOB|nr:hypothetical protein [Sulfitobacter alexandrii]APE43589.1 hypothetical protein BOO69_09320 [Sulfitobacter alexandrii]